MAFSTYPLRPSAAGTWGPCPGSVKASVGRLDISGPDAERGEAAHYVCERVLTRLKQGFSSPACGADLVGQAAENGVMIDADLAESAQEFIDDVARICGPRITDLHVEESLGCPSISNSNGGTADAWLYVPETRRLIVWDYKNGHGEVKAEGNSQLINYAEAIRAHLGIDHERDQGVTLTLRIVQPHVYRSSGPVDSWTGALSDIRGHVNTLRASAAEALSESPRITSGAHCRYCPARVDCSASRRAVYNFFDVVQSPYDMDQLEGDDLATDLALLKAGIIQAQARADAVAELITHKLKSGEAIDGLALAATYGREQWSLKPEAVEALAAQFGFSVITPAVPTPAQCRKKAPAEVRAAFTVVSKDLTSKEARGLKLIDAAESVASKVFKQKK